MQVKAATELPLWGCLDEKKASVARVSDFASPKLYVIFPRIKWWQLFQKRKIKTLCEPTYICLWLHAAKLEDW